MKYGFSVMIFIMLLLSGCGREDSDGPPESGVLPVFPSGERQQLMTFFGLKGADDFTKGGFLGRSIKLSGAVSPANRTPDRLRCSKYLKYLVEDAGIVTVSFKSYYGGPAAISALYNTKGEKVLCFDVWRPKS